METIIMTKDHLSILKRVRRRSRWIHGIGILITLSILVLPYVFKLQADVVTAAYRVAKLEFDSVLAKQELLGLLRSKPMTVGQSLDLVDVVMSQRDVPIPIVLGVIAQESSFKPEAVSNKGARGLMQVMPATYRAYSKHPLLKADRQIHDPVLGMQAGISYLGDMKKTYGTWQKALRAYFAGPENAGNKAFDWYASAVIAKAEAYERQMER